jgi:hypothetical protein
MAKAKKLRVPHQTPVLRLDYIRVVTPDTKYGAPTYQLSVTADASYVAELEALHPSFKGLIPFKEKDDGSVTLKVKQRRYITWFDDKGNKQEKESAPVLLNHDNTPYTGVDPWGGTTGEVAMFLEPTSGPSGDSIALRLKGVRFHDIVLGGGGGDGDPLFGPATPTNGGAVDDTEDGDDDDIPFSN